VPMLRSLLLPPLCVDNTANCQQIAEATKRSGEDLAAFIVGVSDDDDFRIAALLMETSPKLRENIIIGRFGGREAGGV